MRALQTHMRVIGAIVMRELSSQQASLMYGYVWALIDVALSILTLLVIRVVIRGFSPVGVPPATYVLTGAVPWFMFADLYSDTERALSKGSSLRAFPLITDLDCVIGSSVYTFITYFIVFVVVVTASSVVENSGFPHFPLGVMLIFLGVWVMGVGFGMVLMLIGRVYAPANKFIKAVLRLGVFLSGVFMPITKFPSYIWPYLTWNPMLHALELIRQYWFPAYVSPVGQPSVIIEWSLGLIAFGLVCERYARARFAR